MTPTLTVWLTDTEYLEIIETGGNYPKWFLSKAHSLNHRPAPGRGEVLALIYAVLNLLGEAHAGKVLANPGIHFRWRRDIID